MLHLLWQCADLFGRLLLSNHLCVATSCLLDIDRHARSTLAPSASCKLVECPVHSSKDLVFRDAKPAYINCLMSWRLCLFLSYRISFHLQPRRNLCNASKRLQGCIEELSGIDSPLSPCEVLLCSEGLLRISMLLVGDNTTSPCLPSCSPEGSGGTRSPEMLLVQLCGPLQHPFSTPRAMHPHLFDYPLDDNAPGAVHASTNPSLSPGGLSGGMDLPSPDGGHDMAVLNPGSMFACGCEKARRSAL